VRPGGQPQAAELGQFAEAEAFGDVAAGVVADGKVGEPVGGGVRRRSRVPVLSAYDLTCRSRYDLTCRFAVVLAG